MTTAKPQDTGQADSSSDDLIAELARMMAQDARPGQPASQQPPAAPAEPVTPAPAALANTANTEVRIPTGTFRIPGMDIPAINDSASPAPSAPSAPPSVAPVSWQDQMAGKPIEQPEARIEPAYEEAPRVSSPMPAFAHLSAPTPAASKPAAPFVASQSLNTPSRGPSSSTPIVEPFKFDFGTINTAPVAEPEMPSPVATASAAPPPAPVQPENDPIADLIAAELDTKPQPSAPESQPSSFVLKPAPVRAAATPIAARPTSISPAPIAPAKPAIGSLSMAMPRQSEQTPAPRAPGPQVSPEQNRAPSVALDPIDEIESLIGEAVRVELSAPQRQEPPMLARPAAPMPSPAVAQQSPVVPPLNAQFAPRRSSLPERKSEAEVHAAAEEAILAAAAVTGAEVGRIRNIEQDEKSKPKRNPKANRQPTSLRPLIGIAVAGTLLLAAGFGLFWVLGMGRGPGTAPVLTADASPVKQAPVAPAPAADAGRSVVMDEIEGVEPAEGEQLVSREQSTDVEAAPPVSDTTEAGLTNRKVRTVTVRPDGTIVSGDDAVAGAAQLPVDRPNVPDLPASGLDGSDLLANVPPTAVPDAAVDPIGALAAGAADAVPTTAVATPNPAANVDPSIVAPVPAPRIANREALAAAATLQPTSSVNAVVSEPNTGLATTSGGQQIDLLANAQPAPAQQASAPGTAAAYVQLSSQRSEAEAQTAGQAIINRWGNLFGGRQLEIQRADLGARGIFYRVVLPSNSAQEASQICSSVKSSGGDCVVNR